MTGVPTVAARAVPVPARYDLALTLGRAAGGEHWRATRTPDGPAAARYRHRRGERSVTVDAWGPGSGWLVEHAPQHLGLADDVAGFDEVAARHPVVARVAHELAGFRVTRSLAVYEALLPTVLAQKVTGLEARRAWRGILRRWGTPAPGPNPRLRVPPAPDVMAELAYHELHRLGVERRRAETLRSVGRHAARLDEAASLPTATGEAEARIRAVPGLGAWSYAEVALTALGDADAVSVGDFHLKNTVSWALTGVPRGDDDRMLELLAPFAPHRGRVCRLLELAGLFAPRYGPRLAPTPWTRPRSA